MAVDLCSVVQRKMVVPSVKTQPSAMTPVPETPLSSSSRSRWKRRILHLGFWFFVQDTALHKVIYERS